MAGRKSFFDVSKPGEYGKPESPQGFICITYNDQRIFVSSKKFVANLKQYYKIPDDHVASMIDRASMSPRGIPEEAMPGQYGLNMFRQRLDKIAGVKDDVIINCQQGVNRSPVAAVIYLIYQGAGAEEAKNLVTQAFRLQRNKSFILNKREHYTEVLEAAYSLQENTNSNPMRVSQ